MTLTKVVEILIILLKEQRIIHRASSLQEIYDPHIWNKQSYYDALGKPPNCPWMKTMAPKATVVVFLVGTWVQESPGESGAGLDDTICCLCIALSSETVVTYDQNIANNSV